MHWAKNVQIANTERHLRSACVALALVAGICYMVCGNIPASTVGLCCEDEYRPVSRGDTGSRGMSPRSGFSDAAPMLPVL